MITNSYAKVNIQFSKPTKYSYTYVGGLVGSATTANFRDSYATGDIGKSCSNRYDSNNSVIDTFGGGIGGGFIGNLGEGSTIIKSYATGSVCAEMSP